MVMEVGSGAAGDVNPFREAIEVINALAEEGDFEFEEAERMAQQQQALEDQQGRRGGPPGNAPAPPRQKQPHSVGLLSLRKPTFGDAENSSNRMTNGDADDEDEGGGESDDSGGGAESSGEDSVILLPRGIHSPRKQIEARKVEEMEQKQDDAVEVEHRDYEEEKENSENGVEVRRVNPVSQAPAVPANTK